MSDQHQQPKNLKECFGCKKNGFPNVLIGFKKVGDDWKRINPDGSDHTDIPKSADFNIPAATTTASTTTPYTNTNQDQRTKDIAAAHADNIQAFKNLETAINNLAGSVDVLITAITGVSELMAVIIKNKPMFQSAAAAIDAAAAGDDKTIDSTDLTLQEQAALAEDQYDWNKEHPEDEATQF